MGEIQRTIQFFESLRQYRYRIIIENGMELGLRFYPEQYHHLVGMQYLTDRPDIANPHSRDEFYNRLRRGKISEEQILASQKYPDIAERISSFGVIEEILEPGDGRIIVEFDPSKPNSLIQARFFLYKRVGGLFSGTTPTFYMLFLDRERNKDRYYPVTYFVEHSSLYMRNQALLQCRIERYALKPQKEPVGV